MSTKYVSLCLLLWVTLLCIFYFKWTDKLTPQTKSRAKRISNGPFTGYRDCNPAKTIGFMKTHKCASTTLQNVILRFGSKQNLKFAFPLTGNYLGKQVHFNRTMLKGTPWYTPGMSFDIFCLHTRWDQAEVQSVLNPDAVFISILRDPVELFVSLWNYGQMEKVLGISIEEYALLDKKTGPFADRAKTGNLGQNQMLWDFGLEHSQLNNETAIRDKIEEIESSFDLIMIAERFDESMVLLRNELCWSFSDVTYLKLNARKKSPEASDDLTPRARQALKDWLWGDYMLYEHFYKIFDEKVSQFGARKMEQQLQILRRANENIMTRCVEDEVDSQVLPNSQKLWGKNLIGYKLKEGSDDLCRHMTIKEVAFIDEIRKTQSQQGSHSTQYDPQFFQMQTKPGGLPDISAMKKFFTYKGP